jgi:penicillin amidase
MPAMPTLPLGLGRRDHHLDGPNGRIDYERDAWGYPRIRARDRAEGVWALGWFHGHDRRGQVELLRLASRGRLMEFLGDMPAARVLDRSVRALGLARDAHTIVARLSANTRRLVEIYCAGFDAGARAAGRPLLGRILGIPDRPWRPEDIVTLHRLTAWFGLNSLTEAGVLSLADLAARGASEADLRAIVGSALGDVDIERLRAVTLPEPLRAIFAFGPAGSNAFAVDAKRSATGHALLMGEFHMEVARIPPVVYAVHIEHGDGSGFVHGVTVPGLPAIAAGRTPHVGWSYTFGHAANVEAYVEQCEDGVIVSSRGREPLVRREETVKIRGRRKPETWTYWDGPRGVVHGDAVRGGALLGMRWRGLDRTHEDFEAAEALLRARTVDDAVAAHRGMATISLAGTFADHEGRIAWAHSGRVGPRPEVWSPRDTSVPFEDHDLPESRRPVRIDPEVGYIASANEHTEGWTAFAEPPYRNNRIAELIAELDMVAPDDLLRISYDERCLMSARLARVWMEHVPEDPLLKELAAWADTQPTRQPPEGRAALERFHAVRHRAVEALLRRRFGHGTAAWMVANPGITLGLHERIDALLAGEHPDDVDPSELGSLVREACAAVGHRKLEPGVDTPVSLRVAFSDPVSRGHAIARALGIASPVLDIPGGPVSVFQSRMSIVQGMHIQTGPAFHLLMDMGTTVTRYNIAGGASERWGGTGYGAGLEAWRDGALIDLG